MSNKVIRLDNMTVYPTAAAAAAAIGVTKSSVGRAIKNCTPCKGVQLAELPDRFDGFDVASDVVRVWCASEILRRAGFIGCDEIAATTKKEDNKMSMPYWTEMINHEGLSDQLRSIIENALIECRKYQTDLYLYIDDKGEGELYEFANVGGNSWLDDDHITIWTDKEHFDDEYDYCTEISEFADALEIKEEELITCCKEWKAHRYDMDIDEIEDSDITWTDVRDMIKATDELDEKYHEWVVEYVRDYLSDGIDDLICDIISDFNLMVQEERARESSLEEVIE